MPKVRTIDARQATLPTMIAEEPTRRRGRPANGSGAKSGRGGDVGFFQAVRSILTKPTPGRSREAIELDHAIRQILSRAILSEEVVDIFAAAGLASPDLSIMSDEFLAEVRE